MVWEMVWRNIKPMPHNKIIQWIFTCCMAQCWIQMLGTNNYCPGDQVLTSPIAIPSVSRWLCRRKLNRPAFRSSVAPFSSFCDLQCFLPPLESFFSVLPMSSSASTRLCLTNSSLFFKPQLPHWGFPQKPLLNVLLAYFHNTYNYLYK